jgi:protein-disulfide isomerase
MELVDRLCAHFGKGSEMCVYAERQASRFRPEFCQRKLERFDENVTELANHQEARKLISEPVQKTRTADVPAIGPQTPPLVLTLFCDFAAPDCARLSPLHAFVANLYGDSVRLVYRQFPLANNIGSHLAAEASLAANAQGKFWEFHDVLYSNQHDQSRGALERYAKAAGLKLPEFQRALDQHSYSSDVDSDEELGKQLFISELPAVFANGRAVSAPYGIVELTQIVEDATAHSRPKP